MTLTGRQRVQRFLAGEKVDRLPLSESFWPQTLQTWADQGKIAAGESPEDHFDLDFQSAHWLNIVVDLDWEPEIIEETEDTVLLRDGNGALLRRMKDKSGTPEHVGFLVHDKATWLQHAREKLTLPDERRLNLESYRSGLEKARRSGRFFVLGGVGPFECMHPLCGHEHMLMGMALEPDWIADMVDVYVTLTLRGWEERFERVGLPDGIWLYEDMGFKGRPFMSPDMYRELIQPGHRRLCEAAHEHGLPVIMHSCGYIEPLLEGMIDSGIDCLQAMEVKAGMDLIKLYERFGDQIAYMGNLDVRVLPTGDRSKIDSELERKMLPVLKSGCRYLIHSDHSIPFNVEYEDFRYWLDRTRELGIEGLAASGRLLT